MKGKTTRRTFFVGAAALTAPLTASAAAIADDAAARLAALEDANAIRALLFGFAQRVNSGVAAAADGTVYAVALDPDGAIHVATDGTATATVPCTVETATPIDGRDTLVEMARLQGDGVIKSTDRRLLLGSFVKRNGLWEIDHVEFRS